jgi:hypothetical protein
MAKRRSFHFLILVICAVSLGATPARADDGEAGRIEFHGYGEVHYNNPEIGTMSSGSSNQLDFHRFVLGWEYEFAPKARVEAEVDFEHAATELELEEAFLEYDLAPAVSLRAGSLLMPVGPLNEFHEPPLYYSVERPYVQMYVIPTTWQENGVGVAGQAGAGRLSYRAYVTAGLDATRMTSVGGLHDVSTKGAESKADDLAGVGRIEYAPAEGLLVGASGYFGGADQRTPGLGKVTLGIASADVRYRRAGFDLRGVFVRTALDGADSVSAYVGETVGKAMQGWYLEAAYDLLRRGAGDEAARSLVVFGRHEEFDTNQEAPAGYARDPAAGRSVTTGGFSYYPIEKIAFKADLEHWEDDTGAALNRVNLGAAFMF